MIGLYRVKGIRLHFTLGENKKNEKFLSLGKLFRGGSHSRRMALESLETTPKLKKSCEWSSLEEKALFINIFIICNCRSQD